MNNNKLISLIGLANRARKVISGEQLVINEVRNNKAKLVILSEDASKNTVKKVTDKCKFYEVPFFFLNDRATLGKAIGKEARVVIAITDNGFAKKCIQLLD